MRLKIYSVILAIALIAAGICQQATASTKPVNATAKVIAVAHSAKSITLPAKPIAAPTPVVSYTPAVAPTLYDYAADLGLSVPSDLTLVLTDTIPQGDDGGGQRGVGVYWSPTNTIYIQTGFTEWQTKGLLAYEYMHYVWLHLATDNDRVNMALEGSQLLAASNPTMIANMSTLTPVNGVETADEETAVMCTRIDASQLSDFANNYCNTYMPGKAQIL